MKNLWDTLALSSWWSCLGAVLDKRVTKQKNDEKEEGERRGGVGKKREGPGKLRK